MVLQTVCRHTYLIFFLKGIRLHLGGTSLLGGISVVVSDQLGEYSYSCWGVEVAIPCNEWKRLVLVLGTIPLMAGEGIGK